MCGRYVSAATVEQLVEAFGIDEVRTDPKPARYNVAPSLDVYSVIERDDTRRLGTLRWGFLPTWAKSLKDRAPINARIEGIDESRMFASAFKKRRCLLPADGFYEWQARESSTRKQPWYIHAADDGMLAMAGVWSVWREPGADRDTTDPTFSCAILTTAAAGRMVDIHDRMPLILPRRLWGAWLDPDPQPAPHLLEVVASAGVPELVAHTITDRVNNVRNDGADLLDAGVVD